METYVFTKNIPLSTIAEAPALSTVQRINEKYLTGVEFIVDTGTPAGLPVGVQLRAGSQQIWPSGESIDQWVRVPVGLKIFHKIDMENKDPMNYTVAFINGDTAAHYAEVHVLASNHSSNILRLAILSVLKGLAARLSLVGAPPQPAANDKPASEKHGQ